jgi:hypothetical protein
MSTTEVIVSIAAEGGSITLLGRKGPYLHWQFARGLNDQTPTFLTDEDAGGGAIRVTSDKFALRLHGSNSVNPSGCCDAFAGKSLLYDEAARLTVLLRITPDPLDGIAHPVPRQ